ASAIACALSELLVPGAVLIMTVKMPKPKPERYTNEVSRSLSKCFERLSFKKLQHNRQEITAFAVLRG
ncbi:MAG: hypothetical protein QXR58_01750, partial [Candidatus Micrarchaeaceae archaeon]